MPGPPKSKNKIINNDKIFKFKINIKYSLSLNVFLEIPSSACVKQIEF